MSIITKLFGTHSSREIKRFIPIVDEIEALSSKYAERTDNELKANTDIFRKRLANGETVDDILPEAFATVREASKRVLGMYHYRVQLIGGLVLHQGRIAEMRTGEGKTLVATLPAYTNALNGLGVHVITVNDYLARRDSQWMGKVYNFLGLSVGLVVHGMDSDEKKEAYNADITYGTNNEFGFDYLRDNMVIRREQMAQRGHVFAIVDEVDSILIDEARTPLIISGVSEKSTDLYERTNNLVKGWTNIKVVELDNKENQDDVDADYIVDEKAKTAVLTARGIKKAETYFNIDELSAYENMTLMHHVNQAIKAHGVMHLDTEYVVKDGEVIIVDDFTGRLMYGRRYSDGLHQAIEAKEKVEIQNESKTQATITFQNYFRMYKKLSGMTGTAVTEETEFRNIYSLDVVEIPTNKEMIRKDHNDVVYKTELAKFNSAIEQIEMCHAKGQPVLLGTVSIEKSEVLSAMLKKRGIPHHVLNAKQHDQEAQIVAQAGKFGSVTISTNMAGRGTDIVLGGNAEYASKNEMRKNSFDELLISQSTEYFDTDNEEILNARRVFKETEAKIKSEVAADAEKVCKAGGLFIIGTERHESRRIDNQLRGRAGRQGDPGESRFYISLEDDLMRLFGGERLVNMVNALKLPDDQPIEASILSNSLENAQKKIEGINFERRKYVLKYDEVMNTHREIIYSQRMSVLNNENMRNVVIHMIEETIDMAVKRFTQSEIADDWDLTSLREFFTPHFLTANDLRYKPDDLSFITRDELRETLLGKAINTYEKVESEFGEEQFREVERIIMLKNVDKHWIEHINDLEQLKAGINLRAYAQKDPALEYKFESADMFDEMIQNIKTDTAMSLFLVRKVEQKPLERVQVFNPSNIPDPSGNKPVRKDSKKVGRNEPCPCGSGKKYKHCCGR